MKKHIITLILILLSSVILTAQTIPSAGPVPVPDTGIQLTQPALQSLLGSVELSGLLARENTLLHQRGVALTLTLTGSVMTTVGTFLTDGQGQLTTAGKVFAGAGLLTTAAGGVWYIVNEFQLISARRKINDRMSVQLSPSGLRLNF